MNPQGTLGGVVVGGFTSGGGSGGTEAQPPNSLFSLFEPSQLQRGGGGTVDPMKILTELDRGLRSPRIGDQCEAIVFFAKLISSYPFPLVVNAAFLKLADLFRVSHNFVRYCILLSFQQCDVHLNKIINVEEILRRIATVLQSNDPIARSITLRILGSMASFVSERHNIHHGIRNCFDSHYRFEVEATLFAIDKLSARSPLFAKSIMHLLEEMVNAITTSMETKLKLVRIFGRLRHDAEMISEARQVCRNLLKSYPSCAFVIALLDTLTSLSARSLFEIPEQEQILLEYVLKDPRKAVKLAALRNIRKLRSSSSFHSHSLPSPSSSSSTVVLKEKQGDIISLLFEFVHTTPYPSLRLAALQVIRSCSPSFLQLSTSPGLLLELCQELLHFSEVDDVEEEEIEGEAKGVGEGQQIEVDNSQQNGNAEKKHISSSSSSSSISQLIAEEVSRILTHAAVTPLPSMSGEDLLNQKNKFAEHVLISLCSVESLQRKRSPNSIVIQQSIVQIAKAHPKNLPMVLDTCVALLVNPSPSSLSTTLFSSHSASSKETTRLASARCISQLPISQADLSVHLPLISKYVSTETNPTFLVPLSMALLRAKQSTKCLTSSERTEVATTVQLAVSSLLKQNLFWPVFLIAREALTRSFHSISSLAFTALSEKVESEAFYFWLSALKTFSEAEDVTCSSSNLLPDVLALLYKGLTHLKGAITTKTPFSFQHSWIELRIAFFEKLMTLKSAAAELSAFQLHPEDPLEHMRNIALQAKMVQGLSSYHENVFKEIGRGYGVLSRSYYEMDKMSLNIVEIHQVLCSTIALMVEVLLSTTKQENRQSTSLLQIDSLLLLLSQPHSSSSSSSSSSPHHKVCRKVLLKLKQSVNSGKVITTSQRSSSLEEMLKLLLGVPCCYPPYFFQAKRTTTIQLSTSPYPKPGEPCLVSISTTVFVLKISGVVSTSKKRGNLRKVSLTVYPSESTPGSLSSQQQTKKRAPLPPLQEPIQVVTSLSKNSFSTQCTIDLPYVSSGLLTIHIQASLVDAQGITWKTGAETTLSIKMVPPNQMMI